ncbi:MAG: ABC transporter ATP-binding protein [Alphaproteobacteria bacterium]|nr:ABC transporter ATP-binding protein [Alphaproteobacteria bacterium]
MSDEPLLRLRGVARHYGHGDSLVRALDGIDLDVPRGAFLSFMGPSGSGKSTALNTLGCLDVPTAGSYRFRGVEVTTLGPKERALLRRHWMGFVFQGFNLLPRSTALENVELPLGYRGLPVRERRERALQALEDVGLGGRSHHRPDELSGGQQQRVAIARALVVAPDLLLADEPTGNLDTATSLEVMELLTRLHADRGITVVMVTHEDDMAAFGQRIVRFRDGRIEADEAVAGAGGAA